MKGIGLGSRIAWLAGIAMFMIVASGSRASLILYEGFDYGATSGSINGKGGAGTEIGFVPTDVWTNTTTSGGAGNYQASGLSLSHLAVVGGCASNASPNANQKNDCQRKYNVTRTGTVYGSFLWKPISGAGGAIVSALWPWAGQAPVAA